MKKETTNYMQTAKYWTECGHCKPAKYDWSVGFSIDKCPCKCHLEPCPHGAIQDCPIENCGNNPFSFSSPEVPGYKTTSTSTVQDEVLDWEESFSKVFTFGGYNINDDKYIAIRVNGNKNDNRAPEKLKSFINSLLKAEKDKILSEIKVWADENMSDGNHNYERLLTLLKHISHANK